LAEQIPLVHGPRKTEQVLLVAQRMPAFSPDPQMLPLSQFSPISMSPLPQVREWLAEEERVLL
jgi:hypothetical protein